jgi:hypothetical protein
MPAAVPPGAVRIRLPEARPPEPLGRGLPEADEALTGLFPVTGEPFPEASVRLAARGSVEPPLDGLVPAELTLASAEPADAVRPGAVPLDAVPPDASLPRAVPPHAVLPDVVLLDAVPPGAAPPDAVPPDVVLPAVLPDAVPPDAVPTDVVPPAAACLDTPVTAEACGLAVGSVRRCTAGAAGALVRGAGRGARGGTGVSRGPVGREPVTWYGARWTGSASPCMPAAGVSKSSLATGRVRAGSSRPETGVVDVVRTSLTSPPGAPGSTAWDRVPVKDGFCQVANRPLNPASATTARPPTAR